MLQSVRDEDTAKDDESGRLIEEATQRPIPEEWKKKRRQTMATFVLHRFYCGLEFSILLTTAWSYVNHGLHNSNPNLFYGLIAASTSVAGIFFMPVAAKWYDKHKRMKIITLIINSLVGLGTVLYAMPFSPYLPVLGGGLLGGNFILSSFINSEIHLVYADDDIQQMIVFVYIASCNAGEVVGPMVVKLLDRVHFRIGVFSHNVRECFLSANVVSQHC